MSIAPIHPREEERLKALNKIGILDSSPEVSYDEISKLAAEICGVPICLVSLISEDRQWFKSAVGIEVTETPRDIAFCSHCIVSNELLMEVSDTLEDERFKDNPLVTGEPHIRFYAGAPLITSDGLPLGSLCVVDTQQRTLDSFQRNALVVLSKQVTRQLEMRTINQSLEVAKANSDEMNEHLQKMVRVISHDLRSPFHGVMGLLDVLIKGNESMEIGERDRILRMLNHSAHQTFGLLENLLDWSNDNTNLYDFNPEACYASQIVDQATKTLEVSFDHKELKLLKDVEQEILVFGDKRMLTSVIRNLLSNAAKFTHKGGRVTVGAKRIEDTIEFYVQDEGVGMEPEQVESLLSLGSSASRPGTTGERGSGIGMTLIYSFLEKHDSKLQLESFPDKGTRASFCIPSR